MRHLIQFSLNYLPLALCACIVSACGGSGGGESGGATTTGISDGQRAQAALVTAESASNPCKDIRPFYWEIGDATMMKTSSSVIAVGNTTVYVANTPMQIASATKWLYSTYFAERKNGVMTPEDVKYLNFQSGYTNFSVCPQGQTVDGCLGFGTNGQYSADTDGYFFYNGGHMQKHASLNGLGTMDNAALASEFRLKLGSEVDLSFNQPQLAGGAVTSAADYAVVLRKMLAGNLQMGNLLGSHPVCTNLMTCPKAKYTPSPTNESWHYSLGHWVEDDPLVGDGAFSSAGAFGFYPWIDASKKYYGVLARKDAPGSGFESVYCGRLIRKAWLSGVAQ